METIQCLDHGYVQLIDTFGDELTIVNAARVSFGAEKRTLSEGDIKLMRYLYREKHMSPFRHVMFRFKIKAPEFVMRQLYKHVVGIEATSDSSFQLHGWNELSGRYKPINDFYTDFAWRKQSLDNKQASDGDMPAEEQEVWKRALDSHMESTLSLYQRMLNAGVAREQARMLLPLNMYTEVIWTASAQAVLNFIELRDHHHAQVEIQEYAKAMRTMLAARFPILAKIWFEPRHIEKSPCRILVVDTSHVPNDLVPAVQAEMAKFLRADDLFDTVATVAPEAKWYSIDPRRTNKEVVDILCDVKDTDINLDIVRQALDNKVLSLVSVFDQDADSVHIFSEIRKRLGF